MKLNLDMLKKLQLKKYRNETGFFLAEGEHLVQELEKAAQTNKALLDCELYSTEAWQDRPSVFAKNLLSERQMAQIAETKSPQGILAVVPVAALARTPDHTKKALYLHEIQDPGNLGTVLRTLAWFGGFTCLLSPGSVDPFNAKVVRASMGAIFHVPIELDVPLAQLASRFGRIACLNLNGEPINQPQFKEFDCYLFGNEARGLPQDWPDALNPHAFSIKGDVKNEQGGVLTRGIESLNLAAAVNICVYEVMRK